MKKIGIKFKDNSDYRTTVEGIGNTLREAFWYRERSFITDKDKIANAVCLLVAPIYTLRQSTPRDNNVSYANNWLKVSSADIFFDSEVDDYVKDNEHKLGQGMFLIVTPDEYYTI